MGLLDLYAAESGINEPALQALPRTLGERLSATAGATFAPDRYFNINRERNDRWQKAIDEIHEKTGQTFRNPYDFAPDPEEMKRLGNAPAITEERRNKITEANRALREQFPDAINVENIDRYIGEEGERRRNRAGQLEGTGNGIGNFIGGMVLETATPHGALGLMIPVTRLPTAAASAVGRTFLGNVLREGAFQGAANAGLQLGAEGLDYATRSETGSAQTFGEIATNVAGAAVFGAALGGSVRALHLKWLGLPESVRANAPLEVRDAFKVIEADAIYSGRNRLGVDPLLHERYQDRANDAVMRGRPVDLSDLTPRTDTAVGQILNQDVTRPVITGLKRETVDLLPDKEIMDFVAKDAPQDWQRLADARKELQAIERRLEKIERDPAWVVDVGKPDAATQRVLDDLESQLAAAKSDARRADIEGQIEGIRESISTATQRNKLVGEREEVAAEVDGLMRRFSGRAAQVADGLIDLSAKVDPVRPTVNSGDAGFASLADLKTAIQQAEFARQARMMSEIVGQKVAAPKPAERGPAVASVEDVPPEKIKAMETETQRILATKGALGEFRKVAIKAIDETDIQARDAQAALGCAVGAL